MSDLPTSDRVAEALLEEWSATGRARIIQAATGGRWEESRSVAAQRTPTGCARLSATPGRAKRMWRLSTSGSGVRWCSSAPAARRSRRKSSKDFEAAVVQLAALGTADPLVALATLAGGEPVELDHVELVRPTRGGPSVRCGSGVAGTPACQERSLTSWAITPRSARCVNPVALEVAFRRPRECWLGVEVSEPVAHRHVVAAATVEGLLGRLFAVAE